MIFIHSRLLTRHPPLTVPQLYAKLAQLIVPPIFQREPSMDYSLIDDTITQRIQAMNKRVADLKSG